MPSSRRRAPRISVVVPVHDEEGSLDELLARLGSALLDLGREFEVILVDDGSTDGSLATLREAARSDPRFRVLSFRRNYGQTAAIAAGIEVATGEVIVTLDADLQNDPRDIELLLAALEEGFDVVSGWRRDRQDARFRRNLVSRVANRLISRASGVHLHDYGCTLKAYRRDVIDGVRLYGEMHRFIPIYAAAMGARITEVPVRHHARVHGRSKYGLERTFKVILDLIVVTFLDRYLAKPMYVFGGFGLVSLASAAATFGAATWLKFGRGVSFIETPLPLLAAVLGLVGVLSILLGLIAELLTRTYYESQRRMPYLLRESINVDGV